MRNIYVTMDVNAENQGETIEVWDSLDSAERRTMFLNARANDGECWQFKAFEVKGFEQVQMDI